MAPLVAKRGTKLAWHFAHKSAHPCSGDARESVIHRRGKEILLASLGVWFLPYMTSPVFLLYSDAKDEHSVLSSMGERRVDVTALHQSFGQGPKHQVFFEICVTHPVDAFKLKELQSIGVSTLEIDLGSFYKRNDWTDEDLIEAVQTSASRKWLIEAEPLAKVIEDHRSRCPKWAKHLLHEERFEEISRHVDEDLVRQKEEREAMVAQRTIDLAAQMKLAVQALLADATPEQSQRFEELLKDRQKAKSASDINRILGCSKQKQVYAALKQAHIITEGGDPTSAPEAEFGRYGDGFYLTLVWYFPCAVIAWQTLRTGTKLKAAQAVPASEALERLLNW